MDILKCKICFNQYDELKHRPRTLGCGHYFCESCIDKVISSGTPKCPVCQQRITVKTASEATVNFAIEELLQNVKISDDNSNSAEEHTTMPILGLCLKHSTCRLNFVCKTHNVKVCRDCTVLDHKLDKCNVISFQDEMELKKKNTLAGITVLLNSLKDAQYSLESHIESKDCEIVSFKSKIEAIQQQMIKYQETMENVKKSQVSAKYILSTMKIKQEELQKSKSNLQELTSLSKLMTSMEDPVKKMNDGQIWEVNIREEYNLMSPFYISTLIKKFPAGVYAIENAGEFNRSAQILEGNGKVHLLALRKQSPPGDSVSIPVVSLETLYFTAYQEVFINISPNGSKKGNVYIRVTNSEHGRFFRNMCYGTYGPSYKGVQLTLETPSSPKSVHKNDGMFSNNTPGFTFGPVLSGSRCIGCKHPINENGSVDFRQTSLLSFTNEIKEDMKRGKVYAHGNDGFIISQSNLPLQGIPIGEVLQGIEVVEGARNYLCQQSNPSGATGLRHGVNISEVGIVLFNQD